MKDSRPGDGSSIDPPAESLEMNDALIVDCRKPSEVKWLRSGPDEWFTAASRSKILVRRVDDYHEIVGGDFYYCIPMELYLVVAWGRPNVEALRACETLEEAQHALLEFL